MQNRVFRLFISSTFSDFVKEREVLQMEVFPKIKDYASKQGYVFQPIDLRWGVSNEAQLDQKTLELCLREVRECKTHIHPNFLIMLGDRYGWVPCPYAIEKEEFEEILLHVEKNRNLLLEWYSLDENQIPSSYILKQREDNYKDFDVWEEVETTLRETLQKAVSNSSLSEEQKRKYFLSATEAEVEEGIIPYVKPTKFQTEVLLKQNKELEKVDPKYVFGFLRDIDKDTKVKDKFITTDYQKAQEFKQRVKDTLLKENTLHAETTQLDEEKLNETYLKEFEEKITTFLKIQIDTQKLNESTINLTPLEIEQLAQQRYAKEKTKNFIAQDEPLKVISNYIADTNQSPLVIYAKSGMGKSAIISKSIEETKKTDKKVIYRFVGATPNSSSSVDVLKSIFEELGIDIRSEKEKRDEESKQEDKLLSLSQDDKQESFEEFSQRVYDEFLKLKDDTVIFIDAIDQLTNVDNFLWLPNRLPKNLKIIISALDDKNYKDDTEYFKKLKIKTENLYQVPEFSKEKELLEILLKKEERTVDEYQTEYFLKQYQNTKSPLYATIASREMKSWKSGDTTQTLASTQKGIIDEFIENLSTKYHHNKEFVQKVLGYIYASRDGLSESELLQLLSQDEEFIKKMAPETYHQNSTKELPLVHWSRLEAELKPFFSKKRQDNEELMYFFHREFEDAIKNNNNQKDEHEAIIKATQKLILQNQDKEFEQNRWGKLYAILLSEHYLRYKDEEKLKEFSEFLAKKEIKESWVRRCFTNINEIGVYHQNRMEIKESIAYFKINYFFTTKLYQQKPSVWALYYSESMNSLVSLNLSYDKSEDTLELAKEALRIREELFFKKPNLLIKDYIISLNHLSCLYFNKDDIKKAIELAKKAIELAKKLYSKNPNDYSSLYTIILNNLAYFLQNFMEIEESIKLFKEVLEIRKNLYNKNQNIWAKDYATSLINLASLYKNLKLFDKAIKLTEEAVNIRENYYFQNPSIWAKDYIRSLNNLTILYNDIGESEKSLKINLDSLKIVKKYYLLNPDIWATLYTENLKFLVILNQKLSKIEDAIKFAKEDLEITKLHFQKNHDSWIKDYANSLDNLGHLYYQTNDINKSLELLNKTYKLYVKMFGENDFRTQKILNNIRVVEIQSNKDLNIDNVNSIIKTLKDIEKEVYLDNIEFLTANEQNQDVIDKYIKALKIIEKLTLYFHDNKDYKQTVIYAEKYIDCAYYFINKFGERKLSNYRKIMNIYNDLQSLEHNNEKEIMKQLLEMLQQNSESEEATFKDLLYLSNYIAMVSQEDEISIASFANALGFIEFSESAKSIFSQIFNLEELNEYEDAKQYIEQVKSAPKMQYSKDLKPLVKQLKKVFKDEPIGSLR